ncbi:MAG: DUF4468 domain-containing protein [Prevotella sp.]|jgi:hypothetical protein|nr:DUF4468 domain-containing protein [Prevotella sp.]
MKKVFLFSACLLISLLCFSQNDVRSDSLFNLIPLTKGDPCYTGVVNIENADANTLYSRAKAFFAKRYKSAKDVIQMDDISSYHIIGKAVYDYQGLGTLLHYTIDIQAKDSRFKYIISNMRITINTLVMGVRVNRDDPFIEIFDDKGNKKKKPNKNLQNINNHFLSLIEDLKLEMQSNTTNEDW